MINTQVLFFGSYGKQPFMFTISFFMKTELPRNKQEKLCKLRVKLVHYYDNWQDLRNFVEFFSLKFSKQK